MSTQLPILDHAEAIRGAVRTHGQLVLSAPPGSGKSTQVPRLLLPESGTAVVLQPRRIAARSLAVRVAGELGERTGQSVGFQVRFEQSRSEATRVLFATYGVFWQRLLREPDLPGVSLVILDEFHERSLEADATLAWLKRLRAKRPELQLVVMSATLEIEALVAFLDAPLIEVNARPHPVDVAYQTPKPQEPVWEQAARGFRHLMADGERGSVLVFLPGNYEIRRTAEALAPAARQAGYEVLELSGASSAEAQQRALSLPGERPCVIVATNVAETSLTIPGVSAVIDSGLARQATYDAERDLDTLRLGLIAKQNAVQRAGRAGRLGPGRCLRLWAPSLETSMAEAMPPEIERLELSRLALGTAALGDESDWLSPPPAARWQSAVARVEALGARKDGRITPLGRKLLRYPLAPALARVLLAAEEAKIPTLVAAMLAILEAGDRRTTADEGDLYLLARDLMDGRGRWEREVRETYRQLLGLAKPGPDDRSASECRREATECWLAAYGDRLAYRQDRAYHLADGRKGTPVGTPTSPLLLAVELHEVAGQQGRQVSMPLYLPVEPEWLGELGKPERVCSWDTARSRVVQERHWRMGALTLRKEPMPSPEWDWDAAEALLVEKLLDGTARLEAFDEDVAQLVARIKLAAEAWPDYDFPRLDTEDWRVIYHELVSRRSSAAEIDKGALLNVLRDYVGPLRMALLDRELPRQMPLPSGRNGRITYFEGAPPELSARLGDMLGLSGTRALAEGRVPLLFDILAPNYRTVQKTFDMTGFWQNTYPEVKKELKRRYPKHPWP
ncbi:MAG TPA: ATP-dependent helicase C-terminal domain-containing protein [Oscillatoriaceae cyanobacterium]